MRRSLAWLVGIAGVVIALDRWTKRWAGATLPYDQPVPVLGDWLRLTYTRNPGVAFGLGQGLHFPYWLFSIVAALVILWMFWRHRDMGLLRCVALSLIFGGAIGNLVDRLNAGEVVDFIEIGVAHWHWPVFNVADMAVTSGVALFALTWPHHDPAAAPATVGMAASAPGSPEVLDEGAAAPRGPAEPRGGETGPLPGRSPGGPVA